MRNLPTRIYGFNNAHDVVVYTVVKDMQRECGQPRHRFSKSPFSSVYTETQLQRFQKSQFSKLENDRVV